MAVEVDDDDAPPAIGQNAWTRAVGCLLAPSRFQVGPVYQFQHAHTPRIMRAVAQVIGRGFWGRLRWLLLGK